MGERHVGGLTEPRGSRNPLTRGRPHAICVLQARRYGLIVAGSAGGWRDQVREGETATKVAGGAAAADRDVDERRMLGQLIEAVLLKHEAQSWTS